MERPSPFEQSDAETAAVTAAIVDYVTRHPLAADTCDGITRWWLPADLLVPVSTVQRALDRLVDAGRLHARRLPSGDLWYFAPPGGAEGGAR